MIRKREEEEEKRKSQLGSSSLIDEQVALQSYQIVRLELQKQYYMGKHKLICQIEEGVGVVGQTLNPTNRAEALESIEFLHIV